MKCSKSQTPHHSRHKSHSRRVRSLPRGKSDGCRQTVGLHSLGLVVIRIYVQILKGKNLKFFSRKLIWSRTEAFDKGGLTVSQVLHNLLVDV